MEITVTISSEQCKAITDLHDKVVKGVKLTPEQTVLCLIATGIQRYEDIGVLLREKA